MSPELIRLNKLIASSGLCSRREADDLISSGRVLVDGVVVTNLGAKYTSNTNIQLLDRRNNITISTPQTKCTKVWLYHKPCGLIVTHKDDKNRKTVFQDIGKHISERVISIGRLDLNSQGLLVLTNDGNLAHFLKVRILRVHIQ